MFLLFDWQPLGRSGFLVFRATANKKIIIRTLEAKSSTKMNFDNWIHRYKAILKSKKNQEFILFVI